MRFYFTEPGGTPDEGLEFADADEALKQALKAALGLARDAGTRGVRLNVTSDHREIGNVTVTVSIVRH